MIDLGSESVSGTNGFPHRRHERVFHLDLPAAAMTDEVMMRLIQQFVLTRATTKISHAHKPKFAEKFQGAVDRRAVDPGKLSLYLRKHVIRRQVRTRQERTQDD